MSTLPDSIVLSLVSHTNVGKTTLARTLLGRDIGTVRDSAHVTEDAQAYEMLAIDTGETLALWDTPGFGDSVRLAKRLRASGQPIGWLLSQVWDRWRDRPFWSSQQAIRNVKEEADVLLYLVNASEVPELAGYVAPELELLGWVDKPIIVLLNQLGPPREPAAELGELDRWRRFLRAYPQVKSVLPLDAFARCWVQEADLLLDVESVLNGARRALMQRLRVAWQRRREQAFEQSMTLLAGSLARVAAHREPLAPPGGLASRLRRFRVTVGLGGSVESPAVAAQGALAAALDAEIRANTQSLIELHGLDGRATGEILLRMATYFEHHVRLDEGQAALWGSIVSGALVGLKADILSGGLTMGGGLLAGGLIGALGAAGLARCVNLVRGTDRSWVRWNTHALDRLLQSAVVRYLAVAHFGRGRGDWTPGESPAHWQSVVDEALRPLRSQIDAAWQWRDAGDAAQARDTMASELLPIVSRATLASLQALYPNAGIDRGPAPTPLGENAQPAPSASQ